MPPSMLPGAKARGRILVSGNEVSLPALATMVGDELAKAGDEPSRVTVVLRIDRRGDCRTVNQVVDLLERSRITRVRLSVEKPS